MRSDYKYDAFGQRIEKAVDADGAGAGGTVTERFAYLDGNVWDDLNGSNVLQTRRLFLDGTDEPFARISSGGTAAWYLPDRQGSIRDMTDNSGVVQETVVYDGFGKVTSDSNSSYGDRYKYTARELDSETGLQLNGVRYYDPRTGRWFGIDPIGFAGGDMNLYGYVANSPTNFSDPSGLTADGGTIGLPLPSKNRTPTPKKQDQPYGVGAQYAPGHGPDAQGKFVPIPGLQMPSLPAGAPPLPFLMSPDPALQAWGKEWWYFKQQGLSEEEIIARIGKMPNSDGPKITDNCLLGDLHDGWYAHFINGPGYQRVVAGNQMVGGTLEATIGGMIAPVNPIVGGFLIFHGTDTARTGYEGLVDGKAKKTLTNEGLVELTGSPFTADMLEMVVPSILIWRYGGDPRTMDEPPAGLPHVGPEAVAPGKRSVHLDIGGEGRYPDAINVNSGMGGGTPATSGPTPGGAGTAGRPIPNLVQARGERLPFANQSVDIITLQHAPIRPATVNEIARVIRPGGDIRLVGPNTPEVLAAHQQVANAVGGRVYQTVIGDTVYTNIIVPVR